MIRQRKWVLGLTVLMVVMVFGGAVHAEVGDKVNINTATVEELMQLDRVGQKYAERIVAYRDQNGPFKAPEEIMLVAGIGQKTFEANKGRIVVE